MNERHDDHFIEKIAILNLLFKKKLKSALDNMQAEGLTPKEMILSISEIDMFKELQDIGLTADLKEFVSSYNTSIKEVLTDNASLHSVLSQNAETLDIIKNLDVETLLGKAFDFSNLVKKALVDGLVGGKSIPAIMKDLEAVNLSNTQLNTVIHTAYDNFGRTVTALAYQDNPEQKFLYGEGRVLGDPTSRATCQAALLSQLENYPDGVTRAQVDEGVYPEIDFIEGGGYNCSHRFYPATEYLVKRQKAQSEKGLENEGN